MTYSVILIQLHFKCKAKEIFFEQKIIDYFLVILLFYEFRTSRDWSLTPSFNLEGSKFSCLPAPLQISTAFSSLKELVIELKLKKTSSLSLYKRLLMQKVS